jgi:hypothetical protein
MLLVLIPWSAFWDRNYFAEMVPAVKLAISNNYVRGAVMGLGLVNVWAAVSELSDIVRGRSRDDVGHDE